MFGREKRRPDIEDLKKRLEHIQQKRKLLKELATTSGLDEDSQNLMLQEIESTYRNELHELTRYVPH